MRVVVCHLGMPQSDLNPIFHFLLDTLLPPSLTPHLATQELDYIDNLEVKFRKVFPCTPEFWGPCQQGGMGGTIKVASGTLLGSDATPEISNIGK